MTPSHHHAVLIVEDEQIVANDLQETLNGMGYDAFAIAASADDALQRAAEKRPAVVLMDIRIKGKRDGVEAATLMRERFGVPIVYLTAHADDTTLERAKHTEPYGYLMKPVQPAELRSAIEIAIHKHHADKRRHDRETWFSTTLSSIADAVIAVDLAGEVRFMNAVAESLVGTSAKDAIGRPVREIVQLRDSPLPSPLDTVLAERQTITIEEASLKHATSGDRIISDSVAPVRNEHEMLGAVMVFRDITEQKRARTRLELADRLASLGTMAAGVAHQVNNPLAVVLANASFILDEMRMSPSNDPHRVESMEALIDLKAAAKRIADIVSELQAFSRPTSSIAGEADITSAVARAIRTTENELRNRCHLVVQLADAPHARLEETKLAQVLTNLLLNAAHAIAPGKAATNTITISARSDGADVTIEVRDTGAGMTPEVQRRMFDPFYTTKSMGTSMGLGMSICHGIVTSAHGRIAVDSAHGQGTSVRVTLPAVASKPRIMPVQMELAGLRRGRILIVDDEPLVLSATKRVLRAHEVVCLEDAREALAMIDRGEQFDVILSDITMPAMSGIDFYQALLQRRPEDARRVVFLSGGVMDERVADFLAALPNALIEKPITGEAFRNIVRDLLGKHRRQ